MRITSSNNYTRLIVLPSSRYNKLCGDIRSLANKIALLGPKDPFREQYENTLLNQLHNLGVIDSKNVLSAADKVSVSAFCRRRLPVIMVRLRMAQYVSEAVKMIEQGHIRVGSECVTDPAFLVPKKLEDYVTWAENSSYKRKIMKYKDKLDDYDLL